MSKSSVSASLKKAVLIIPTYNEAQNISRLVPVLLNVFEKCSGFEMHILVVDDTSPDGTADVVRTFSKKYSNVHLLVNAKKNGLGAAYLVGMTEAFSSLKADIVFQFDADLSHDPQKIPDFLKKINEGYDLVLGSRYIAGGSIPSNWGFHRKFLSVVGNLFIQFVLTNFSVRDWTTGYRALTREVFDRVGPEMKHDRFSGYTFQIGFLHKTVRKGFKIAEVPFQFIDREIGHSKLGAEYIKNTLLYILKVRLQEILAWRFFKFAVVGFIGFFINTLGLFLFARLPVVANIAEQLHKVFNQDFINTSGMASALGAECAIVSNFILNNVWTFKDRKITSKWLLVPKFLQFNISSVGAVLIQFFVVGLGTSITGQTAVSRFFWLVVATALGMILNFTIYNKFIWKVKRAK